MSSQEQQLLQALKTYENTLVASAVNIQASSDTGLEIGGTIAEIAASVLLPGVGTAVVAAALAVIKLTQNRTFDTDNYYGALLYEWFVLGEDVTDPSKVTDGQVLPALEWMIYKTGVFVSGRQHIYALQVSAEKYMSYYSANAFTTQDATRVQLAVDVVQKYMKGTGSNNAPAGSWANCIGVYDNPATAAFVAGRVNNVSDQTSPVVISPTSVPLTDTIQSSVSAIWTEMSTGVKLFVAAVVVVVFWVGYKIFGKSK